MADRFDLINLAKSITTTLGGPTTANVNIDANTLFIDGTNNRVGVGTNAPTSSLHIETAGGTATRLRLFQTGITNYEWQIPASVDAMALVYNGTTERMRINSAGDVSIGTPSPAFGSGSGMEIERAGISTLRLDDSVDGTAIEIKAAVGAVAIDGRTNHPLLLATNGIERVRINTAGTVTLASHSGTGSSILSLNGTVVCSTDQESGRTYESHNFNTYPKLYSSVFINIGASSNIPASSSGNGYRFVMGAGDTGGRGFDLVGTSAGQLYYRARENGTWYQTSAFVPSDYRIKQNIIPIDSSIETLKLINPVSYRYKNIASPGANNSLQWADDGQNHLGFIAHELKEAIPSAVNGEKDAVTDVGGIQPQTLNVMPIVALLTSALQEAVSKIETLEARIEALENK